MKIRILVGSAIFGMAFLRLDCAEAIADVVPAGTIAYVVPAGTVGNQVLPANESQSVGMDFDINFPIFISSLGVFDSGGNGLNSSLTAHIYDRDTHVSLIQLTFLPANPGTLIGGSRFLDLAAPLLLAPGFHGVIAVDYLNSNNEPQGNLRVGPGPWTTDSGGGLISFVGSGRTSPPGTGAVYPNVVSPCPANCFAAGTFTFVPVPEPSTLALVLFGTGALVYCFSRKR